jgi:hypothetical protein
MEIAMDVSLVATVVGSFVLLLAATLVARHYQREHRRQQVLRHLSHHRLWDWTRHRH